MKKSFSNHVGFSILFIQIKKQYNYVATNILTLAYVMYINMNIGQFLTEFFFAMQPFKVEMIQDNYTTSQNTKQHELYFSHCHSVN